MPGPVTDKRLQKIVSVMCNSHLNMHKIKQIVYNLNLLDTSVITRLWLKCRTIGQSDDISRIIVSFECDILALYCKIYTLQFDYDRKCCMVKIFSVNKINRTEIKP